MPFNANKKAEHGKLARRTPTGVTVDHSDATVGGSTLTEVNAGAKSGSGAPASGVNAANAPLDRVRVDSGGRALTTNQGVAVADNQNSLKAGLGGDALLSRLLLP